jgi:outer membrane protein assembly factor BamB
MKNTSRFNFELATALILVITVLASAQDWTQWRGANRDGKVSGFKAPKTWPKELTQKWQVTVGLADATPALVGSKLYVAARKEAEEVVLCLDAENGKELWRDHYSAPAITGPAASHPGPRSTPTVAEGKVITLGVGGVLSCYDAATGKVVWRNDEYTAALPDFFPSMSPIVVDGMVIAHLGGKEKGTLLALDLTTGALKWKWEGEGPSYSSPILMTADGVKQIVLQTEKSLIGVAASDGKLLWQVATPPEQRYTNSVTPVVEGQTVIYTGQGLGTKAVKIEKQGDAFAATALWNAELGNTFNTPVLKDGLLYSLSDRSLLFCLDAQTGKTVWAGTEKLDRFGAIVDAGSVLFALPSSTAQLIVFKAGGTEFVELARYKVSDKAVYSHPVISGKRIFIKDEQNLTLWMLE